MNISNFIKNVLCGSSMIGLVLIIMFLLDKDAEKMNNWVPVGIVSSVLVATCSGLNSNINSNESRLMMKIQNSENTQRENMKDFKEDIKEWMKEIKEDSKVLRTDVSNLKEGFANIDGKLKCFD